MLKRTLWLVAAFAAVLALATCGGNDGGTDGNNGGDDTAAPADTPADPGADAPFDAAVPDTATADVPGDLGVEAETGATPTPSQLGSTHTGWKNPRCLTCHTYDAHNDGNDPYLCAGCHDTNGAPTPPHEDRPGCACHSEPHGADGFPSPLSCKACHFPQ